MKSKWFIAVFIIMVTVLAVVWYPSGDKHINNKNENNKPLENRMMETNTTPLPLQSENETHYPDRFPKQLPPHARVSADSILYSTSGNAQDDINGITPPQAMYNYPFPKNISQDAVIPEETKN